MARDSPKVPQRLGDLGCEDELVDCARTNDEMDFVGI